MKKINVDLSEIAVAYNNFYAINSKLDEFGVVPSMNGFYNELVGSTPNFAERFKYVGNSAKMIQIIYNDACNFIKKVIEIFTNSDAIDIFTATATAADKTGYIADMLSLIAKTLSKSRFVNSMYYGDLKFFGNVFDKASLVLSIITFGIKGGLILYDIWDSNKSTLTKTCDVLATGVSIVGAVALVGLGGYLGGPAGAAIGAFLADGAMSKDSIQALSGSFEAILTADINFAINSASKCVGNAAEVLSKSVSAAAENYWKQGTVEGKIGAAIELCSTTVKTGMSLVTTAANSAIGVVGSIVTNGIKDLGSAVVNGATAVYNWFTSW